ADLLAVAQDKSLQRTKFAAMGLPVPPYALLASAKEAIEFGIQQGYPFIIKAGRGGYDGRGVWRIETPNEAESVSGALLDRGITPVAEANINLVSEFSQQIARRPDGEISLFPLVETVQSN